MTTVIPNGIAMPHPYLMTATSYNSNAANETSHSPTDSMSSLSEHSEQSTPFTESRESSENSTYFESRESREETKPVMNAQTPKKRGPGRPRKPDHLLARPRRERNDGGSSRKRKRQSSEGVTKAPKRKYEMKNRPVRKVVNKQMMDTQRRLEYQADMIESLQDEVKEYRARIKELEMENRRLERRSGRNDSSSSTNTTNNSSVSTINHSEDTEMDREEREDSPLSVYSDLNLDDLVTPQNDSMDIQRPWGHSRDDAENDSFVVVLKANPVAGSDRTRSEATRKGLIKKNLEKKSLVWNQLIDRFS